MSSIDVLAKLYALRNNLDALGEEDRTFVNEVVKLHESGGRLSRRDALRVVQMAVPGEATSQDSGIWTLDAVNVVLTAPGQTIWRYMHLDQLFFLLSKKELHFSPLSVMKDTSEGKLPGSAWERTKSELPDHGAVDAETITAIMVAQRRQDACINCWYMGDSDSLHMWQQYAPRNGVAIQTTVLRLGSALRDAGIPITIGPITYFGSDQHQEYADDAFYGSLFNKHEEGFSHENELRALAYRVNAGHGVNVPVPVETLIQRLILSPELPHWAIPSMTQAIQQFGFVGLIEQSTATTSH